MYCSSCGSALTPNLVYCNRCGAKVDTADTRLEPAPDFLIAAMVGLFILGIGVIIGLLATMRQVAGFDLAQALAITIFCFSLLVVLEGILVFFLFRTRSSGKLKDHAQMKEHTTRELEEGSPLGLPPQAASVTEHTTRAFDPVYIERNDVR
ncbi:MAG TPA: hypothetical protein VLE19_17035 [Pyrinomonadaceae bacterium]|nr:hypothetical protein [Pyrinomonadaceae bacterium]